MPSNVTREDLLAVLDDIRQGVASGDTLEGSIQFTLNYDEPPTPNPYDVQAAYRVGNLQGQGGMRMIGHSAGGESNADSQDVWLAIVHDRGVMVHATEAGARAAAEDAWQYVKDEHEPAGPMEWKALEDADGSTGEQFELVIRVDGSTTIVPRITVTHAPVHTDTEAGAL